MMNSRIALGLGLSATLAMFAGCIKETESGLPALSNLGSSASTNAAICTILNFENNFFAKKVDSNSSNSRGAAKSITIDNGQFYLKSDIDNTTTVVAGSGVAFSNSALENISNSASADAIYTYNLDSTTNNPITAPYFTANFHIKVLNLNVGNNGSPTGTRVMIEPNLIYNEGICGRVYFYSITNSYLTYGDSSASVVATYGRSATNQNQNLNPAPKDKALLPVAVYDATLESSDLMVRSQLMLKVRQVQQTVLAEMRVVAAKDPNKTLLENALDLPQKIALRSALKDYCQAAKQSSARAAVGAGRASTLLTNLRSAAEHVQKTGSRVLLPSQRSDVLFNELSDNAQQALMKAFARSACEN